MGSVSRRLLLIPPKYNYPSPEPSLDIIGQALPYIAGTLKQAGHQVFGLDMNLTYCADGAKPTLERMLKQKIAECQPEMVCLSGLSQDYLFVKDTMEAVRKHAPDVPIVIGGGIISFDKEYVFKLLRPDYVISGEGEDGLNELLECIDRGCNASELDQIPNLGYWKDGDAVFTFSKSGTKKIEDLPFPDYEPFDFRRYLNALNQSDNGFHVRTQTNPRMLPISMGRSCPYRCTFCCHRDGFDRYRRRSIENAIEEMVHFYELYQFNVLKIYDELFSVKPDRIREMCQLMKKAKLPIHWSCSMRVPDVDRDLLREMKDAGCIHVGYGFESASDKVLTAMVKRIKAEQIQRAVEWSKEVGIGIQANFIFGDPNETVETAEETKSFYYKHCTDIIVHNAYIIPYPGTVLFDHCEKVGKITDKLSYYENLHVRTPINMTAMPDEEFYGAIEPIVADFYSPYLPSKAKVFRKKMVSERAWDLDRPPEQYRDLYEVEVDCPHCKKTMWTDRPLRLRSETFQDKMNSAAPLVVFCSDCHRRFAIPVLDVIGLEEEFNQFLGQLNSLAKTKTPVVVLPYIDRFSTNIYKFYGMKVADLNVASVMDHSESVKRCYGQNSDLIGLPYEKFSAENVAKHRDATYVILPNQSYTEWFRHLLALGVPRRRIVYFGPRVSRNLKGKAVRAVKRPFAALNSLISMARKAPVSERVPPNSHQ